jgi:signal transduction histidine kinase
VMQAGGEKAKTKTTFIQLHNIKSFAGISLIADGEVVGVMFVNYRTRRQFDTDNRQMHELFAQQAAVAIKNVESGDLARDMIVREERNHLSRELHHSVSQALFGIKLKAQTATSHLGVDDDQARAELGNILDIAHLASNETLFMIEELRAPAEESRNLKQGLESYTQRITNWYGLQVVLNHDLCRPLAPLHEQTLLRFAREAINNAVRHSHCKAITVRCGAQGSRVLMSVRDDGIGFDPSQVPLHKLGLKSMRELAESVGGCFSLETAPGAGTTVSLQISEDMEEA